MTKEMVDSDDEDDVGMGFENSVMAICYNAGHVGTGYYWLSLLLLFTLSCMHLHGAHRSPTFVCTSTLWKSMSENCLL